MSENQGRRRFLEGAAALTGASWLAARSIPVLEAAPVATGKAAPFPKGFRWGAATASYQIEGAWKADGKGESVWDRFSHTPGKVKEGATGDVACDHYSRWREDVGLLKALGMGSYRFSIAWPRIQPTGRGPALAKGLDFYSRLVDELLAKGIRPFPTLYHWDLPQALEDGGGWTNRETADRFAEYAGLVAKALGDRVSDFMVFNEPAVFVMLGYGLGIHAPGRQDFAAAMRASHVVNLAQGDAVRVLRAARPKARIGGAWNMATYEPYNAASEADKDAARRWQAFTNSWYIDPALLGRYPDVFATPLPPTVLGIEKGDFERIKARFDFIGINHYNRSLISTAEPGMPGGLPGQMKSGEVGPKTDMDWEVWPRGFHDVVAWAWNEYKLPIEITENGCAYSDGPDATGKVNDVRRVEFYRGYLTELARAIGEGADVRGYHAWSLMDNFEWAEGYTKRFGIVHVDYATQKRTIKESGRFLARWQRPTASRRRDAECASRLWWKAPRSRTSSFPSGRGAESKE